MVLWAKKLAHEIFLAHAQTVAAQGFQGFLGQKSIFQFNLSQKLNNNNKKLTNIFGLLAQSVFLSEKWAIFEILLNGGFQANFWVIFEENYVFCKGVLSAVLRGEKMRIFRGFLE